MIQLRTPACPLHRRAGGQREREKTDGLKLVQAKNELMLQPHTDEHVSHSDGCHGAQQEDDHVSAAWYSNTDTVTASQLCGFSEGF